MRQATSETLVPRIALLDADVEPDSPELAVDAARRDGYAVILVAKDHAHLLDRISSGRVLGVLDRPPRPGEVERLLAGGLRDAAGRQSSS